MRGVGTGRLSGQASTERMSWQERFFTMSDSRHAVQAFLNFIRSTLVEYEVVWQFPRVILTKKES